jgi:hypothetical protein
MTKSNFRNLYLLAGIRGEYEPRFPVSSERVGNYLVHGLEDWGIPSPWGPCDSGAYLESEGDVLRTWAHVDLRMADGDPERDDVPVAGLLQSAWDILDLFGTLSLTGIDAMVPLPCAGDGLRQRVNGSWVMDEVRARRPDRRARVTAARTYYEFAPTPAWDHQAILEALSKLIHVEATMDEVPSIEYSESDSPFGTSDPDPVRAEVLLPDWTIADAAWLAEAIAMSCREVGIQSDAEIAVRLVPGKITT